MLLMPTQIKPKLFELRQYFSSFFFSPGGGCVSCLPGFLGTMLLPVLLVPSSGRVWRKVLESNAGSVCSAVCCLMQMLVKHFVIGTEKQWFVASVLRHPRSLWHVEEGGNSRKVN